MSQFTGATFKVRCVDCTKLNNGRCQSKNSSVAPRKKRTCTAYEFKGEYTNREPAGAVRVPFVDKNTRRLMRKLSRLGVTPISDKGAPNLPFQSTATAGVVSTGEPQCSPAAVDAPEQPEGGPQIWTPDSDEQ